MFRFSEKATKIWNYLPLRFEITLNVKIKWKITSYFCFAFSENLNLLLLLTDRIKQPISKTTKLKFYDFLKLISA